MSIVLMSASDACLSREARKGLVARLVRRIAAGSRARQRRETLQRLLAFHDGILDDLGVSRAEISLASPPRLPADVLAWIGRAL